MSKNEKVKCNRMNKKQTGIIIGGISLAVGLWLISHKGGIYFWLTIVSDVLLFGIIIYTFCLWYIKEKKKCLQDGALDNEEKTKKKIGRTQEIILIALILAAYGTVKLISMDMIQPYFGYIPVVLLIGASIWAVAFRKKEQ